MALFLSTVTNKVDRKGRVSVPAGFRTAVAGQSFAGIVVYPSFQFPALEGCDINRIAEMSLRMETLEPYSQEYIDLTPIFADSQQLGFDGDGRVVLPEALCTHAGITDAACFVGCGQTFQIWEPGRYRDHHSTLRANLSKKGARMPALKPGAEGGR